MDCEVKYIQKRDIPAILKAIKRFYSALDAEYIKVDLQDIFKKKSKFDYSNCLCIWKNGKIIGSVIYQWAFVDDNICEASYLWIEPRYRHKGLALFLMKGLINELKLLQYDFRPILLMVSFKRKVAEIYKNELGFSKLCNLPLTDNCIAVINLERKSSPKKNYPNPYD